VTTPAHKGPRLLWEADPILVLVTELRATSLMKDLERLRARLVRKLGDFQDRARNDGLDPLRVAQATEVLSALIDHVVTSMPWGADAGWKSLGGSRSAARRPAERILDVARSAATDSGVSELVCVALGLGFDKRSRGADDAAIEQVLASLTQLHRAKGSARELRLSPDMPASSARRRAWTSWLPLWVSSLVVAALLAVLFVLLSQRLEATSDRLSARIAALRAPAIAAREAQQSDPTSQAGR
jgi:type VI secretion system protein ImpK